MALPITFLSDYGHRDEFAGVCRAVIARLAPEVRVTDLTHGIPRHAVRQGAVALADSLPYAEPGVHLAVVDPGVGSDRRPVAVRTVREDRILVGPDNGLLGPSILRFGGAAEAADLSLSRARLEPVSATFHGRDIFAPVAARLASGAVLREVGERLDPSSLARLELPRPRIEADRVLAHVLYADAFGNAVLDVGHGDLSTTFLRLGERVEVRTPAATILVPFGRTFSDVEAGQGLLYEDSGGRLALAINRGSAAGELALEPDEEVALSPG